MNRTITVTIKAYFAGFGIEYRILDGTVEEKAKREASRPGEKKLSHDWRQCRIGEQSQTINNDQSIKCNPDLHESDGGDFEIKFS